MAALSTAEQAAHMADLAETYREMLSDFSFVSVERRREFVRKMRNYQDRCAELMAAPAIVAPDWTKAPTWAQWWAVDSDGEAYWFDTEPHANVACWDTPSFKCQMRLDRIVDLDGGHWYRSLTQRPQEAR